MPSKTSSVTSNSSAVSASPSWFTPFQQFGASEASRLYGEGGPSPLTTKASGYLDNLLSKNPSQDTWNQVWGLANGTRWTPINQALSDTASGKYLGANPYLDQMFQSASRPVVDTIQAQFSKAGRVGSGANQDILGRTLSEMSSNIYGQDYARERQNQLQAGNAITGFTAGDYARNQQLAQYMGDLLSRGQQQQMQGLLFTPQLAQEQSGQGALTRYLQQLGLVNPGTVTTGSQQQPITSNPFGEAVGIGSNALIAASLASRSGLFDKIGGLFGGGGGGAADAFTSGGYGGFL